MNRSEEELAALLAEHGGSASSEDGHHRECAGCAVIIGLDPRTPRAGMYLAACRELVVAHQAEVIAAAGWRKGREEWGVRFERDAGPTMDNPSGEVTNTQVVSDESHARACVERNVPISARNRRVVRRYVTDWEEA